MKNSKLIIVLVIGIFITLYSCQEENDQILNESELNVNNLKVAPGVTGHIYYATWEEWGRAAKDCKGWGLCNYSDCWGCCTDDITGEIVDCESGQSVNNGGTVYIDEKTGSGYMLIELDPTISVQQDAITNKLPFYIDENIAGKIFILLKGEYLFDTKVGKNGGYTVSVKQK